MTPSARSLILDLLSTLREGSMPVRALVAAGGLFGLAENNVRVTLARLVARGSVERDERGRYRLGPRSEPMKAQITSWRRVEERISPAWDGSWVAVHTAGLAAAREGPRRRRGQALRLFGFRALVPGLEMRPNNWTGGVASLRAELLALGLEPQALVAELRELDGPTDQRARALWDMQTLEQSYRDWARELDASETRLPGLSLEEAMVETFLVGGRVLRQILLDPLLPAEIADPAQRAQLVGRMRDYDRVGRSCWASFLENFGVPHRSAPHEQPMDLRVAAATERVRRAS